MYTFIAVTILIKAIIIAILLSSEKSAKIREREALHTSLYTQNAKYAK